MSEIIANTYEIKEMLGQGGGGVVYLARHLRLDKNVVLKADKRKITTREELLRREVNTLKDLSHPYIPQVYDFFVENDTVYTVIDFVPGESLDKPLKRHERFSQPQVIKWGRQLLEALVYLHSPTHGDPPRGYVHSDIKPANLMRTPDGDICLIDFNIALAIGEENFVGLSEGYASPEHYGQDYTDFGLETTGSRRTASRRRTSPAAPPSPPPYPPAPETGPAPQPYYPPAPETQPTPQPYYPPAPETQPTPQPYYPPAPETQPTPQPYYPPAPETQPTPQPYYPPAPETQPTPQPYYPPAPETQPTPQPYYPPAPETVPQGREAAGYPGAYASAGSDITAPVPGPSSGAGSVPNGTPLSTGSGSSRKKIVPDIRSDIYSVGATLYHLLSGHRPARDAKEVVPLPADRFSPQLVAIIAKAMHPNPDLRYQTAAEMLDALEHLYENDPRTRRLKRQRRWTYLLLFGLFVAGGLSSFVGLKRIQTIESRLKLVEYSKNALAEGDSSSAVAYALEAIPEKTDLFTPPMPAAAQMALTEALGVYDLRDGFKTYETLSLPAAPLFLTAAPDGSSVACISASSLYVFDTESCEQLAVLPAVNSALAEARYLDIQTVLYAGQDGLTAYDLRQGAVLWQGEPATAVCLSADGSRAAAVYRDESFARVYSTADGSLVATVDLGGRVQSVVANDLAANPNDNLLALNSDGTRLAVSFADGGLIVYDLNGDDDLTVYEQSDFSHFEGGFSGQYLAFGAFGSGKASFEVIDVPSAQRTGGFTSTMPYLVHADESGIYVAAEDLLVQIDPVSGEQTELAYIGSDIRSFCKSGSYTLVAGSDNTSYFFGPRGTLLSSFPGAQEVRFVSLAGLYGALGNMDDPTLRLLRLENHPEAQFFSYDPAYTHNEARLSADGSTVMLFRYDSFRLYSLAGEILADVALPDAAQVYDQQFRREGEESWLEVTYNSGLIRNYSAKDGSVLSEEQGEPHDGTLFEEYLTDRLRIEAPLHGQPTAYDRETGKLVAELEPDDYLTYVTQTGEYIVTEYMTAEGDRYGLLLDADCQPLARIPDLCDVLEDGSLLFDDMLGNIRQSRIYSIDTLLSLAKN